LICIAVSKNVNDSLLIGTLLTNTSQTDCDCSILTRNYRFDAVGLAAGRASAGKKLSGGMLAWLSVWGEMQICICPADATATLSLAPVNPDWSYLPGFTFLVSAHQDSPKHSPGAVKW